MKNNEYNVYDEINKTKEYQNFEAVQSYIIKNEAHTSKNETLITEEYGNSDKTKKTITNKKDKGIFKKLIQKVSEAASSLAGGIAATASVAIASVIIMTSVLIRSPNIELLDLVVGYDYVSYNLYIDEMDESLNYYSVVSNNFETHEFELYEGENKNTVYNLMHDMEYDLYVVGINEDGSEEVKYFNKTFYTTMKKKYINVQWVVEGNVIETDEIEYGESPIYDGLTPTKASSNEYDYTFKSWIEEIDEKGNITYIAEFEPSVRKYEVKWVVEGNVIETDEIEYGESPVYDGLTPTKASSNEYDYTFKSWIEEIDEKGNITYIAEFEPSVRKYEVKWVVEDNVIETDEIEYGESPIYDGLTPTKASSNEYDYTFKSWIEEIDEKGNITYIAEFEPSVRKYEVKWVVEGNVIETDEIEYGESPVYDGLTPTKDMTLNEEYEFIGWDKEIVPITEDVIYTAVFNVIKHEYVATYDQVNASDVYINYDNSDYYVMTFNTGFNNSLDSRLSYRIILTDIDANKTYIYEGVEPVATINVERSVVRLSITYESIGIYNEMEKVFESITLPDLLEISVIDVIISDNLTLVATNEYQLSLSINSEFASEEVYNSLTLLINYSDSSTKELIINDLLINQEMIINIPVLEYCSSFRLDYTLDLLGANGHNPRMITGTKEFVLESNYELVRVYADPSDFMRARFLFKYHFADQETTLAVKDVLSSNITTIYEGEDYIEVELDSSLEQQEFTYYLSSLDGSAKGSENSIVVNMAAVEGVYEFQYVNPGEAVVTFNEDDTMNIYLNTFFETEDVDIWYLVRYTDYNSGTTYDMKYTESVAYIEYIPFSNYGIEYFVYKTIDGIDYQLYNVSVSGGVEVASTYTCEGNVSEDDLGNVSVFINYYDYYQINSESFVIIADGNEYAVSADDVIHSEGMYTINYLLSSMPSELIVEYEESFNEASMYELVSSKREVIGVQGKKKYLVLI